MTFKTNHQHLAQRHELMDHPDQQHLLQEGLSGFLHQLLCWWLFLRPPSPRENNSLLNSSHHYIFLGVFLLRLGATEAQTREGSITIAQAQHPTFLVELQVAGYHGTSVPKVVPVTMNLPQNESSHHITDPTALWPQRGEASFLLSRLRLYSFPD